MFTTASSASEEWLGREIFAPLSRVCKKLQSSKAAARRSRFCAARWSPNTEGCSGQSTLIQPVSSAAQTELSRVSSPIGQREEDRRFLLEDGKEAAALAFF